MWLGMVLDSSLPWHRNPQRSSDPMKWHSQSIDFAAESGTLHGELILPEGKSPFPGAVLCHGLGADHRSMRPSALRLARHGIATLSFDFRGHGKSEGLVDGNEAKDVIAALERLFHHPKIDPQRIALVGHSMGAAAAIPAAAEAQYLRALILLSLPPGVNERAERFLSSIYHKSAQVGSFILEYPRHGPLPGTGKIEGMMCVLWMWLRGYRLHIDWEKSLEIWSRLASIIDLERLGAFSKLFVHCKGDRIAPYESVLELYRRASPPKELFEAERGFHSTPLLPGRLRKRWIAWLASVLTQEKA